MARRVKYTVTKDLNLDTLKKETHHLRMKDIFFADGAYVLFVRAMFMKCLELSEQCPDRPVVKIANDYFPLWVGERFSSVPLKFMDWARDTTLERRELFRRAEMVFSALERTQHDGKDFAVDGQIEDVKQQISQTFYEELHTPEQRAFFENPPSP